jgi:energy-coupling factor transport system permease protein
VPVLTPLFVLSFRRADELALAMEARCYRPGIVRTRLHPLKAGVSDAVLLALTTVVIVVGLVV